MTIARTIEIARQHKANGNTEAARRILMLALRSALSDKARKAYTAEIEALH